MDAFRLLHEDHAQARSLFEQIKSEFGKTNVVQRQRLFEELRSQLELHAKVEDLHVYRVFQQAEPTREGAARALEAHRRIKTVLDELSQSDLTAPAWVSRFQDLHQLVDQHVVAEEAELFAQASKIMTPGEMEELGALIQSARQDIQKGASAVSGGTPE